MRLVCLAFYKNRLRMLLTKKQVIHSFNKGAAHYNSVSFVQRYAAERLLSFLPERASQNILEIGSGTGILSQFLTQLFPAASILLLDIAPAMVSQCDTLFANNP